MDAGGWIGATDRLEPIEAALSALAACINVGISSGIPYHILD